jgi:hypothetical protein
MDRRPLTPWLQDAEEPPEGPGVFLVEHWTDKKRLAECAGPTCRFLENSILMPTVTELPAD